MSGRVKANEIGKRMCYLGVFELGQAVERVVGIVVGGGTGLGQPLQDS